MCRRARTYAVRNSYGSSGGNSSKGFSGVVGSFSSSFSFVSGAGGFINVGCMRAQNFFIISGMGTESRGFLVRTIKSVVAMYNGSAASTSIPNTNPGKPRSSARNRCCQYRMENISKLNSQYSIAHMAAI